MAIPSIAMIPSGYKTNKVYSVLPTDGSGDLDFARTSTGTRVNSSSLIEEVGIGKPRLDYSDGSCPSLLLETSSTNLITQSEAFGNSYWTKSGASVTGGFSAPSTDSPLGAFKLVSNNVTAFPRIESSVSSSGNNTLSVFVKKAESNTVYLFTSGVGLGVEDDTSLNYVFNFTTLSLTKHSGGTAESTKVESYANGWYKISVSMESTTISGVRFYVDFGVTTSNGVYIFGSQLEQQSHGTSYIPTSGTIQTRTADSASKNGISSLINSSEGVLYFEGSALSNGGIFMTISINDGSSSNHISFLYRVSANEVWMQARGSSGTDTTLRIYDVVQNQNNKVALSYSSNGIKIFVNGALKGSSVINDLPVGLNSVEFNNGAQGEKFYGNVNDLRVYKTSLTDAELAVLTTI